MSKDFFVGIYDPVDVRRNLLESSKCIIKSLKSSDELSNIREKKLKYYKRMRRTMEELHILIDKLKEQLPRSYFEESETGKGGKKTKSKVTKELEKLDKQLQQVEKELSSLK